jgi:glycerol-3-phosphate acyltransferase PlsX
MGGDSAPDMVIDGVARACLRFPNVHFLLFGDQSRVEPLLSAHEHLRDAVTVRHTDQYVRSEEKPSTALRQGKQSSMQLAIKAVGDGEAKAVVSAGNTGALMAMSKVTLKTLNGIDRPAIGGLIPTRLGESVMLDLGANVGADANNLVQFGMLGAAYARTVLGRERPTVGLINVGQEEIKGGDNVQQAAALFRAATLPFDFYGFVEGDDLGAGTVDVFVVDGFAGNIALKTLEGTVRLYTEYLRQTFKSTLLSRLAFLLARNAFNKMRTRIDPRLYNGATLLGLNGIVVKSHGGTDGFGFANAIGVAVDMVMNELNDFIMLELAEYGEQNPTEAAASG